MAKPSLILLIFLALSCAAAPPAKSAASPSAKEKVADVAEVVSKLQKTWDSTKSYQADFKQIVLSKRMGTRDENEGQISVSKPNRLRWESKTDGSLQILNGKKLTNVQENKRRKNRVVDVYKDVNKVVGSAALNFLSGKAKFRDLYTVKLLSETPQQAELKMTPKREGEETMIAEVDKQNYFLRALTTENEESRVRLEFSNIKTNVKLDDKLFEYKPESTDVVHEE